MNIDNTFGELLKTARVNKGWTQEELAEKMTGIQSKQNISNYVWLIFLKQTGYLG